MTTAPLQPDAAHRRRLRWRSRRGLLENDLVLQRYFEQYEATMNDEDVAGLDELLAMTDNELLDLILCRTELPPASSASARQVLGALRRV